MKTTVYFRVTISALNICYILEHYQYGCHNIPGDFHWQAIAEKRILLNDPDLLQSQIHALERKVEDVVAKNNDLFTKYNDQSNKYNDLATKYTDLSAKYNTLLTKTNGLYM